MMCCQRSWSDKRHQSQGHMHKLKAKHHSSFVSCQALTRYINLACSVLSTCGSLQEDINSDLLEAAAALRYHTFCVQCLKGSRLPALLAMSARPSSRIVACSAGSSNEAAKAAWTKGAQVVGASKACCWHAHIQAVMVC